jgi:hypothetical protein
MAHIPLCALKGPLRRVLVVSARSASLCKPQTPQVGGGDGGVVREISRHACVEQVDCAEIDAMVPEASLCTALRRPSLTTSNAGVAPLFPRGLGRLRGAPRLAFPALRPAYLIWLQDSRVTLHICDGLKFVAVRVSSQSTPLSPRPCRTLHRPHTTSSLWTLPTQTAQHRCCSRRSFFKSAGE